MVLFELKRKIALANLKRTKALEARRLKKKKEIARQELELEKIEAQKRSIKTLSVAGLTPEEKRILMMKRQRAEARAKKVKAGLKRGGKIVDSILKDIDAFAAPPKKKRMVRKPTRKKTTKRRKKRY